MVPNDDVIEVEFGNGLMDPETYVVPISQAPSISVSPDKNLGNIFIV